MAVKFEKEGYTISIQTNALSFSVHEVYNVKNIMIEKGGSDDPL